MNLIELPTGKLHISYSEIKTWSECSYRHKLSYVNKINMYEENPYADFGSCIHEAIENYLKSGKMDIGLCIIKIKDLWNNKGYDSSDYIEKITKINLNRLKHRINFPITTRSVN